tara:strand:- start:756 stop:1700 length:945 start_codon:yes stop_codon:yes gene_type:complete
MAPHSIKRVFIVGVGRSGTSLLQSMVAAHRQIVMMPETSFVRRYLVGSIFSKAQQLTSIEIQRDPYIKRWEADHGIELERLHKGTVWAKEFYLSVVNSYAAKGCINAPEFVGEKDPKMVENLSHLETIFKDYKVIHIIRDPRDVILSKNKAEWSKRQSLVKKLVANSSQLRIAELFKKKSPNMMLEVRYEDLISNPEFVLKDICKFLTIDYDPNMLDFQGQANKLIAKDEISWKRETIGPLLSQNSSKWRTEMPVETCCLIEACCAKAMTNGGYEKSFRSINCYQRVKISFFSLCVNFIAKVYVFKALHLSKAL